MSHRNNDGGAGGPWGRGTPSGLDFEDLVRRGQEQLKQLMPSGSPRGVIVLAVLALLGLGVWSAFYTVPSDSVAVAQRFTT